MHTVKPVLLVEDDDLDAMIVKRSLNRLNITNQLVRTRGGEKALAYLGDQIADTFLPCAILLDLNMPRMNGFEFLEHVRSDSRLRTIPVLVITTSTTREDRAKSLQLGAAAFIVKSYDYQTFLHDLAALEPHCDCSDQMRDVSMQGISRSQ